MLCETQDPEGLNVSALRVVAEAMLVAQKPSGLKGFLVDRMTHKQRKLLLQLTVKYKLKELKKKIYKNKIGKLEGGALIADILAKRPIIYN